MGSQDAYEEITLAPVLEEWGRPPRSIFSAAEKKIEAYVPVSPRQWMREAAGK
jgi:hypothetical protein